MLKLRKASRLAVLAVAGLAAWLGNGRAQAQYGGYGGFGWGLFPQTPAAVSFLNDHALARTGAAAAARPQPLRAPIPVSRDVEFFTRYDAATRAAMTDRVSRRRVLPRSAGSGTQASTVADSSQAARAVQPLASFFNTMRELVWPADAPTEGDLRAKRAASDLRTLETLMELEARGYAHVATAADARNKLLDYGRPALQFMRDTSTAAVSDAFHSFLLALYDSIGKAPEQRPQ
jgi:hypothetical protein